MATTNQKKALVSAIVMGAISIGLYALLFVKEDLINSTFGKGGMYALLPIATAFSLLVRPRLIHRQLLDGPRHRGREEQGGQVACTTLSP